MFNAEPQPFADGWMLDLQQTKYEFIRYNIYDRPRKMHAVYAFVRLNIFGPQILYIGKAENVADRLSTHERLNDACMAGATELWIHRPGPNRLYDYLEVERRLIHSQKPALNEQHTHREENPWMNALAAAMTPAPRNALDLASCFSMGAQRP